MAVAYKEKDVYGIWNEHQVERMCRRFLSTKKPLMVDTETTGFNPRHNRLVAIQLCQVDTPVCIVYCKDLDTNVYAPHLRELFGELVCVGHNLSFDYQFLAYNGMPMRRMFDTQIAEQVINGVAPKGITLKYVVEKYAGVELSKEERNWFIDLDKRPEWTEPFPTEQIQYMMSDVRYLPEVVAAQIQELKHRKLDKVFKLEMRALPAVASMEMNGIQVDKAAWQAVIDAKCDEAQQLEGECLEVFGPPILEARTEQYDRELEVYNAWVEAKDYFENDLRYWFECKGSDRFPVEDGDGWGVYKVRSMRKWREEHPNPGKPKYKNEVNIASSDQLMTAFQRMGIEVASTGADELERQAVFHPELKPLLKFKKANKMITAFGSDFLTEHVDEDGRCYPSYHLIGAETGRMSSYHPNWQQIPSKGDGAKLRAAVVAKPGHKLLVADFSNIELRILADLSGDHNMLSMFLSGQDLHTYTARMMFKIPATVSDNEIAGKKEFEGRPYLLPSGIAARSVAKTINFGIAYGQSKYGFALKLNTTPDEAEEFINQWYELYSGARAWLDKIGQRAVENQYSTTVLGRKRYYNVPPEPSGWEARRTYNKLVSSIRRAGMNHPIQGTSADMTKLALALFYERSDPTGEKLVACVHDEIVVETPAYYAEKTAELLADCMHEACTTFLKRVAVPKIEIDPKDRWEK